MIHLRSKKKMIFVSDGAVSDAVESQMFTIFEIVRLFGFCAVLLGRRGQHGATMQGLLRGGAQGLSSSAPGVGTAMAGGFQLLNVSCKRNACSTKQMLFLKVSRVFEKFVVHASTTAGRGAST